MPYSQDELDALKAAYARGHTTVKHGDKTLTYTDGADMLRRIRELERQLATPAAPARRLAVFRRD